MKTRKFWAIVCVLVLLAGVMIGCSLGKKTDAANTQPDSDQSFKDHYKFSMVTVEDANTQTDEIYKTLAKKFNLEFEVEQLSFDTWGEKVKIEFASGLIPDVVQANIGNLSEVRKYQKQGTLHVIPNLDPYPNLKKLAEQNQKEWDVNKIDGKNYHWPRWNWRNLKCVTFPAALYRMDWAQKLGYNYEQIQVVTQEELYKLAADFTTKDPGGNGPGKTIGLGFTNSFFFPGNIFSYNVYADKYVKENGKYVWGAALPSTLDAIKLLKKAYDMGGIDKDFFTRKDSDTENAFPAGKMGIMFYNIRVTSYLQRMSSQFKATDPDFDFLKNVGILIPTGPDGTIWEQEEGGSWSEVYFSSKLNDAQIERLFKYMDYTVSEEGTKLCLFGLKGIDFKEENGQIISLAELDEKGNPKKTYLNGGRAWKWPVIFGELDYELDPNVTKEIKEFYKKAETKAFSLTPKLAAKDWDYQRFSAPNKDKFGTFNNDVQAKITELVVSSKDVEKDWNDWLKQMQPKVDAVLKELNEGIK